MSKHSVLYQMYDRCSDFTAVNILCTSDPTYHCLLKQKSSNCVIWTSIRLTYRYGEFCSKINIVKISETLIIWTVFCYTAESDRPKVRKQ